MRLFTSIALVLLASSLTACSKQQTYNAIGKEKKLCLIQGGSLITKQRGDQSIYDVCIYEDNRQCELKALAKGLCRKGGFKITGYTTKAAQYCAITGGRYAVGLNSNTPQETGSCTRNDRTCDAREYFENRCELP